MCDKFSVGLPTDENVSYVSNISISGQIQNTANLLLQILVPLLKMPHYDFIIIGVSSFKVLYLPQFLPILKILIYLLKNLKNDTTCCSASIASVQQQDRRHQSYEARVN